MKTMTTTTNNLTEAAISTAIRNGDAQIGEYDCMPVGPTHPNCWFVQHRENGLRCYIVDAAKGTCTCEAFGKSNVCKHMRIQHETARLEEMEARAEEAGWIDFAEVVSENGAEWPTCPYHGAYEEAANGTPMSVCDGCMRRL